jgi:ATP-dependent Clp protease ATP-binding subunit ClpX
MDYHNANCSFCRKGYREVGPLVEGPGNVYICPECVELCQSIIKQEKRRRNQPPAGTTAIEPVVVRAKLDHLVCGQEEAKAALTHAACRRHEGTGHILLIGPSVASKLWLARALAHALEVPFAAGDSHGLANPGCGAEDVLLYNLLHAADFDVESAQHGVVYVDGVERQETQEALLRLWQANVSHPLSQLQLETRGILFVCDGTFSGLDEATARLGRHAEQAVTQAALAAVGVRPDWAGYVAAIARVAPFDDESLSRIVRWVDFSRVGSGPV